MPGRAQQYCRPVLQLAREIFHRRLASRDESRLQHEILGRITGDEELGSDDEIGMRGFRLAPRIAQAAEIPGDIADGGIELGNEDTKRIGHDSLNIGDGGRSCQSALDTARISGCSRSARIFAASSSTR